MLAAHQTLQGGATTAAAIRSSAQSAPTAALHVVIIPGIAQLLVKLWPGQSPQPHVVPALVGLRPIDHRRSGIPSCWRLLRRLARHLSSAWSYRRSFSPACASWGSTLAMLWSRRWSCGWETSTPAGEVTASLKGQEMVEYYTSGNNRENSSWQLPDNFLPFSQICASFSRDRVCTKKGGNIFRSLYKRNKLDNFGFTFMQPLSPGGGTHCFSFPVDSIASICLACPFDKSRLKSLNPPWSIITKRTGWGQTNINNWS